MKGETRRGGGFGRMLWRMRRWIVLAVLALTVAASLPSAERVGDRVQIALPVLGLGCSVLTGGAGEYLLRYVAGTAVVHGSKAGLGERALNERPRGGYAGFPSGHMAAASFGASALVSSCLQRSPFAQGVVILAAGFTGASRIEAGAHTIWQVLAGALVGWGSERLLRARNHPLRRRLAGWARALLRRGRG